MKNNEERAKKTFLYNNTKLAMALPREKLNVLDVQLEKWLSIAKWRGLTLEETRDVAKKIVDDAVHGDILDWAYRYLSAQPPGDRSMKIKDVMRLYQRYRLGLDVNISTDGVVTIGAGNE